MGSWSERSSRRSGAELNLEGGLGFGLVALKVRTFHRHQKLSENEKLVGAIVVILVMVRQREKKDLKNLAFGKRSSVFFIFITDNFKMHVLFSFLFKDSHPPEG